MKIKASAYIIWCFLVCFGCKTETKSNDIIEEKVISKESQKDLQTGKAIYDALTRQGLIDIQSISNDINVDLKYSTTDNFFKKDVYGNLTRAFLQKKPAEALVKIQAYLSGINPDYQLIVFDAARPLHIQEVLWQALDTIPPAKRKDFVADPAEGSIHNYGCAVDLSIWDDKNQNLLDMGTSYDFFGELAYPKFEQKMLRNGQLSQKQYENRKLLRRVMAAGGFMPITSEWWHFNYYSRAQAKKLFEIIK